MRTNALMGLALAAVVAVVFTAACSQNPPISTLSTKTTVKLAKQLDNCMKVNMPVPIYGKKNGDVTIQVESTCRVDDDVVAYDFAVKGGASEDPMTTSTGECHIKMNQSTSKCEIKFKVKDMAPGGKTGAWVYTYKLKLKSNGRSLDPEVVIEW